MTKMTKIEKCRECGSTSLTWFTTIECVNDVPHNRQNPNDMVCRFVLGCDDCSETLRITEADKVAGWLNREEPAAPVASNDPALIGALSGIVGLSRALRQGGPAPEDLQELSDALEGAVGIAHDAIEGLAKPGASTRAQAGEGDDL